MEIYQRVMDYLERSSQVCAWEDLHRVLKRAAARQPRHWQLPLQTCLSVGGSEEQAVPAVAAIGCMHIGILLVDDMLDEDPRGEHLRIGAGAAANLSAAFAALGMEATSRSAAAAEARARVLADLAAMMLTTAWGQHLDSRNPIDEEGYWQAVGTKSSPFFGSALYAGAVLGGAPDEIAAPVRRFGRLYGEMVQIHDDLSDVLDVPANPDWTQGRYPLPLLYAHTVQHPERRRFLELRADAGNPAALREAQEILVRCGAVSYAVHQLIERYREGRELARKIPVDDPARLSDILNGVIEPVRYLLRSVGVDEVEEFFESGVLSG
jgi:geranylgeranyl pyrophosphate synthase